MPISFIILSMKHINFSRIVKYIDISIYIQFNTTYNSHKYKSRMALNLCNKVFFTKNEMKMNNKNGKMKWKYQRVCLHNTQLKLNSSRV